MKRFVTTLIVFVACLACALGLAACNNANPVAGKTYEFEKATVESGASGTVKETTESSMNELYTGSTLSFGNDGNYTLTVMNTPVTGTYKQSGSKITLTSDGNSQKASVSGENIIMTSGNGEIKVTLTYKPVVQNNNEQDGDEQGGNEQGGVSGDVLAGKTFILTEYLMNGTSILDLMPADMKIVFNQNDGFTMSMGPGGDTTGTYTINNNKVTLTPNIENGEPITLDISDGTLLWNQASGTDTISITFTLQA